VRHLILSLSIPGILVVALLIGGRGAAPAAARGPVLQIDMFGSEQVPPVETNAWGFIRFFFEEDLSAAEVTVDVKGLSGGQILGADIHRGRSGLNGPVVYHLVDGDFIVTSGHLDLTAADLAEMRAGAWYVSLKTTRHPEGELRGQIVLPSPVTGPAPSAPPPVQAATAPAVPPLIRPPSTGSAGLLP